MCHSPGLSLALACVLGFVYAAEPSPAPQGENTGVAVGGERAVPASPALTTLQLQRLRQALEPLHAKYDPRERMLEDDYSSPGYHTTLRGGKVHSTRAALTYAVACLDMGEESLRLRAEAILDRVIRLQDQDPASKTYGIWSWFLEEPLHQMSPPDWNWADFCGTALLQVALEHRTRITPELMRRIDESIRHAADSIRKRNVGPSYTNIAIMGTYVTLVAAELYGLDDLRDYAVQRWRKFYEHTLHHGGFTEYNSPTYTIVALKELARLLRHARDPEVRRTTAEVYEMAWKDIAQHFHAPTRQWSGPHSRCYRTLLGQDVLSLITRATEGRVDLGTDAPSIDEPRLTLLCPRELDPYFTTLRSPRELRQTFVNDKDPVIGTTYLAPEFCLGSVNRGDFWNQRRPLLAYAGRAEAPQYLRVRFLHDGYDFTAAQFFAAQKEGIVVAAIGFAADGGDTHPNLDKIKNETIHAKDLRLRFEFGNAPEGRPFRPPKSIRENAVLPFGKAQVMIGIPHARWDASDGRWEASHDDQTSRLDVVLYTGESKEFNLAGLPEAALGTWVAISTNPRQAPPQVSTRVANGRLELQSGDLRASTPLRPRLLSQMRR